MVGSVASILTGLGYNYTFVQTNVLSGLSLSSYSTVILGMDGGTISYSDMGYLASAVNAGTKLIILGGSGLQIFAQGVNDFFIQVNTNIYTWTTVSGTPDLTVTSPSPRIGRGPSGASIFLNHSATYYMARVMDGAATTGCQRRWLSLPCGEARRRGQRGDVYQFAL